MPKIRKKKILTCLTLSFPAFLLVQDLTVIRKFAVSGMESFLFLKQPTQKRKLYYAYARQAQMHRFLSVCPSTFVGHMLWTTSMVQSYVVHRRPVLCTTDLHCAPWCTRET